MLLNSEISLSKKLGLVVGIGYSNYHEKKIYDIDTSFVVYHDPSSVSNWRFYWIETSFSQLAISIKWKYFIITKSSYKLSVSLGPEFWFPIKNKVDGSYYTKDSNGSIDLGPYNESWIYVKESGRTIMDIIQGSAGLGFEKSLSSRILISGNVSYIQSNEFNIIQMLFGLSYKIE